MLPSAVSYNTAIFGFVRNLTHPMTIQFFEIRYSPLMGMVFLLIALLFLVIGKPENALLEKIFLSAGVGYLGFSLLRLAILTFYRHDLVWFVFCEETTELMLMGGLAYLTWVFRSDLILRRV